MKRKREEEEGRRKEVKQRSVCDAYGGDGWPEGKGGFEQHWNAPNIIGCFGEEITTGENGEMVYNLLLEYGSGGTLADLIEKSGGCGLPESHNCGFGGTEFKPKIGDFGLAKRAKQSNNKKRKVIRFTGEMITGKPPWVGKGDLDGEELLRLIGEGHESPKIPDELSKDTRQFLKGCFSRKTMFRLTADMLLNHSFVEGLVDDFDVVEEEDGFLDADDIDSSFMLYETDDDFGRRILEVQESADIAGSTVDDLVDTSKQVPNNTMQQRAIGFTIPAGG
ncbi:hypothetical protein C3L33_00413, partial [Rhododendron williamsianum]